MAPLSRPSTTWIEYFHLAITFIAVKSQSPICLVVIAYMECLSMIKPGRTLRDGGVRSGCLSICSGCPEADHYIWTYHRNTFLMRFLWYGIWLRKTWVKRWTQRVRQ